MSAKDDNLVQPAYGVSHLDGVTPVAITFTSGRAMNVDAVTTIAFDPSINASRTPNDFSFAKATSSADNSTCMPWVVNASTGAVLINNA